MPTAPAADDTARLVALARRLVTHADEAWPLAKMAADFGLSPSAFQRRFVALVGVSPKALQDAARLGRLKATLKSGGSVTDAILEAGFSSPSRIYGEAQRNLGMTPSTYRAGGADETIDWACRATRLGLLLMAATERGVCFAQFGDSETALAETLANEFPKARLRRSAADDNTIQPTLAVADGHDAPPHAPLNDWIDALNAHLSASAPAPTLPLDLRGTAFQMRVWRFLQGIPLGTTCRYADVAAGIGSPKATRAVGSACGANRVAVLVPCHRVLRGDGGLGGYRWGIDRKHSLLAAESSASL